MREARRLQLCDACCTRYCNCLESVATLVVQQEDVVLQGGCVVEGVPGGWQHLCLSAAIFVERQIFSM